MLVTKRGNTIKIKEIKDLLKKYQGFALRGILSKRAAKFLRKNYYCVQTHGNWVFVFMTPADMPSEEACKQAAQFLG